MAVKLRLKRMGAKKTPFYRIVAAESRSPRDGRFIEIVGTYNPIAQRDQVTLKEELVLKWLSNGAQPTDTVRNIFSQAGIMQKFHESKPGKAMKADKPAKETKPAAKPTKSAKTAKEVKVTKEAKTVKKTEAKQSETEKVNKAKPTTKKAEKVADKPAKAKKETKKDKA